MSSKAVPLGGVLFNRLHRASSDNLPSRFRFESRGLLGEGIDALARLRSRLLYDDELGEPGTTNAPLFLSSLWPIAATALITGIAAEC